MSHWPGTDEIRALDDRVLRAFANGDESGLDVIGYGEISTVLALESGGSRFACKRLPPFADRERARQFTDLFAEYVATLTDRGVRVVDSRLVELEAEDGSLTLYCIQHMLDKQCLGPEVFAHAADEVRRAFFAEILARVSDCVDSQLGLDGQLSNWALVDDQAIYIDITTPMMRTQDGDERLDWGIYLAALPWLLRGPVRWFVLKSLADAYYQPRTIVVDFLANLYKERLDQHVDELAVLASEHLGQQITARDAVKYYRSNARTYAFLLRVRRMDRAWQRTVRRRTYPFLLPGPIAR